MAGTSAAEDAFNTRYTISLDEPVGSLTISPRNRDACLAARKGIFILDLEQPYSEPLFLPHAAAWEVADVQWSPHPSRAQWICSAAGQNALIWNLDLATSGSSPIQYVLRGHNRSVTDINFSTFDPNALATVSLDGRVYTWDLREDGRRPHLSYNAWHIGGTQVKYNRQDPNILASAHDNYIYVWDNRNGSAPVAKVEAHRQRCYGLDWDRKRADEFCTCSLDKTIKTWSYKTPDEPINTIHTTSPVWRARHLPFGDGLLALPQRNDPALSIYTKNGQLVDQLGHHLKDTMKEFVWRTRGGTNPSFDDRDFQLITWGKDRMLRMWPISQATLHAIGHVHGDPIPIRMLHNEEANYDTFRTASSNKRSGLSAHGADLRVGSISSMTPPSPVTRNLVSSSLGRSKNRSQTGNQFGSSSLSGTSLGTSPTSDNEIFPSSKSGDEQASSGPTRNNKGAGFAVNKPALAPQYMSGRAAAGRNKNAVNAMAWMEGVQREEEEKQQEPLQAVAPNEITPEQRQTRLQDEFAQVSRKFSGKVMFERMNVATGHIQLACYGPWGAGGTPCFVKTYFSFPPRYPLQRAAIGIEKSGELALRQRAVLLTGLRAATKRCADRCEPCLDTCISFLLHQPGNLFEPVLSSESEEDEDAEHRNAVPLPRRSGAIFGPNDTLICFFPTDNAESASSEERDTNQAQQISGRRRRSSSTAAKPKAVLFDTFGSIPMERSSSALIDTDESDEALRIPRGMGRASDAAVVNQPRSSSRGGAVAAAAATAAPYSSIVHFRSISPLTPVRKETLPPTISSTPEAVAEHQYRLAEGEDDVLRASIWAAVHRIFCSAKQHEPASLSLAVIADFLSESIFILQCLKDLQSLGLLACTLELFFRQQLSKRPSESLSEPLDIKQGRRGQQSRVARGSQGLRAAKVKMVTHPPPVGELPALLASQLEQHRFAFAKFLLRLDLKHLHAEALGLTQAALKSASSKKPAALLEASGLLGASLELTARNKTLKCVICQKSCTGLSLGCLSCLHGGHSECMSAWFNRQDPRCPVGSCDCECS